MSDMWRGIRYVQNVWPNQIHRMFKNTYYATVLATIIGGSAQFYSYDVINPAQSTLIRWLNQTYAGRGTPKTEPQLNLIWSVVVSSIAVGAIFGALSTKPLADRLGRRNALIWNGLFNVFGALFEFFARPLGSPELLILGRVILGANAGLTSGLVPMFLMEITPTKFRGAAGTCHMVAVAFSDWFSMLLGLPEVQLAMCSVSLTLLSFFMFLQNNQGHAWAGYAAIGAVIVYMCVYGVGCAVPWLVAGEIFPTKYRPSAVTVAVTVAWSLSFVVSTCYLPFQQIVGNAISYIPFIIVSAGGAFFVYFLLPETRGKQATDIVREIRARAKSISVGQSPFQQQQTTTALWPPRHSSTTSEEDGQPPEADETTALLRFQQKHNIGQQQLDQPWRGH